MAGKAFKELLLKRFGPMKFDDGHTTIVEISDGEFVKADDVKANIRRMISSGRLSPETATRIITLLGL